MACALRLVDAQGIERRALMQEPGFRRDRDKRVRLCDQNRLPELVVPRAEAQRYPLEGRQVELRAEHEPADLPCVASPDPGYGFPDRADGDPGLIVDGAHRPLRGTPKPVLELSGTPVLVGGMPRGGHERLSAGHGPRIPRPVRDVITKVAAFV